MRKRTATPWRFLKLGIAMLAAMALVASCSSDDNGNGNGGDEGASGGGDGGSITIGYIPWDEDIAVTYLWAHVLEEKGYDVEVQQLDVAPTFQGVADGDLDLFFDVWLPVTHADYWETYEDQVENLGIWYDNAKLTIAVPDYVDAQTIADLAANAAEFNGQIIGIEPGAGLTRVTRDEAMPAYGLDGDYELVTSSTTAMLASLKSAIDAEEPIVVTLWRPHWAYSAFDIRDLEDPEGAMGEAEEIATIARIGFTEDFPEVAEAIENWTMDDDHLGSLEDLIQQNPDDIPGAVEKWVNENTDYVESMF